MGIMDFENVTAEQLRHYQKDHKERDYVVIDVRQPEEYTDGHIPGARLLPLDELEDNLAELSSEQEIFFYCRSGARSQAASIIALDSGQSLKQVNNLIGGFMAWDGHALRDFPKVQVFERGASLSDLMYRSMDLEKAAQRFYLYVHERHTARPWAGTIEQLSKAEVAHARAIYKYWKDTVKSPEPFTDLYGGLPGEVLEGGETLKDAVARVDTAGDQPCIGLMEMALTIEIQAYDLYRSMADQGAGQEIRDAFLSIAQMEKKHMQMLAGAIRQC